MRLTHDSRDPTRPILPVFFCQKHFVAAAVDVSVPTVFLRAPTMRFLDAIRDSDDKVHAIEFPESVKSVRQLRGRRRGGAASVSRPEAPPSSSDLCESTDRNSAPSSGSARASSGEASSRQEGGKSEGGAAALHPLEPDPEAWPLERRVPSRSIFAARSSGRDGARRERGGGGTSLGCVVEETGGGRTRVSVRFGNPAPLIAAAGVLQKTMFGAAAPEDLLPDFEKGVDSTLFCGRDGTPLCSASDYCWGVPGYVLVLRKTQERLRAADQGQISFYGGVDGPGRERIVSMRWHTLAVHSAFFLESMRAVLSSEAWATHDAGSGTRNHISGTLTEARKAGVWKPSKSVDDMVTSARRLCEIVETLGGAVGWWLLRLSSSVEMVAPLIVPFSNGRDKDADLEVCMAGESNNGSVSGASVLKVRTDAAVAGR